ncbi:MAG: ATP-binding protein [Myxococcota bacterium]
MRSAELYAAVLAGLPVGVAVVDAAPPHRVLLRNAWLDAHVPELPDALDLDGLAERLCRLLRVAGEPMEPSALPLYRALERRSPVRVDSAELRLPGAPTTWVTLDAYPLDADDDAAPWALTLREISPPSPMIATDLGRLAFEATPSGLLLTRADGRVVAMNEAYRRIIGLPPTMLSEALQHNITTLDVYREAGLQPYIEEMLRGTPFERELRLTSLVGEDVWVVYSGVPIRDAQGAVLGGLLLLRDVANQRALERRARQSESMEATARLAGGVAHDINNTMTAVAGYAELLLAQESDGRKRRYLAQIADAAGQVTHVVGLLGQLRRNSARQAANLETVDLAEAVWSAASEFAKRAPRGIEVVVDATAGALPARVSRERLITSIDHILRNAFDAMPRGGVARVQVSAVTPTPTLRQQFPALTDGRCALIRISDTGVGIAADRLHRIFEPYSSGRGASAQKGMGLGLAIVYAFVAESQGGIVVRSAVGHGTRVELTLPLMLPVR